MKITKRKTTLTALIIYLIFFLIKNSFFPQRENFSNLTATPKKQEAKNYFIVKKVIDGDTIELENGEKIRYIGVDTPELHHPKKTVQCFAREAMLENKKMIEGKMVRLEKDISETDKYKRLLRYVFIEENNSTVEGIFINKYLIREGFGYAATFPPDIKYSSIFVKEQEKAREQKKGLWNKCQMLN